ncbi:hypothetical protein J1N35_019361 [Gossypium stocksii]|uniref:Uncharacterized protein n=1 Tax=Gossypium stocksii TaxID=47602 RepID=A0A9D3VR70_9ROSI|nr:hypothetical protein J1N35_019361 [Gossypium stocksii]
MGRPPRVRRKRTMVAKGASFSILLATLGGSCEKGSSFAGLGSWFCCCYTEKINSKNGSENGGTDSTLQKAEPQMVKAVVLASLEKFFKSILNMLEVERKFIAVVDAALEAHPHYP